MIVRAGRFLLALCLWGCLPTNFDVWIEPPPPPPAVQRVPARFESHEPPPLVATDFPGLMAAPSLDATLYYYAPHERWYRHAFHRWYEAFRWDGYWFPPERVPDPLEGGPLP